MEDRGHQRSGRPRQYLFAHDTTLPGFEQLRAHARNMAFQDGGLQMLQQVLLNPELMPIEKAITNSPVNRRPGWASMPGYCDRVRGPTSP